MTFDPWKLIAKIVGTASLLLFIFNRGKRSERQEIANNNYEKVLEGAKRKQERDSDSDATIRERLLKDARDAK